MDAAVRGSVVYGRLVDIVRSGGPAVGGSATGVRYAALYGRKLADDIAADPELLQIYIDALTSASEPMARQAAAAFGACARTLSPLGPDSPWVEWAQYCLYRATEVNEVYRLEP